MSYRGNPKIKLGKFTTLDFRANFQLVRKVDVMQKKQSQLKGLIAIIDPVNIPSRKILINNGFHSQEFKDFDGLSGEILNLILQK